MKLKPDPIGEPRNSLAVFLLMLCLLSGGLLVFGVPTAGSIEALMPPIAVITWGVVLLGGSLAVLLGMFWPGDPREGLLMKRVGFLSLIVAGIVYGGCVLLVVGSTGLFATVLTIGFSGACALQYRKVNRRIHAIIRESSGDLD